MGQRQIRKSGQKYQNEQLHATAQQEWLERNRHNHGKDKQANSGQTLTLTSQERAYGVASSNPRRRV